MYLIEQRLNTDCITNIEEHVQEELERIGLGKEIYPGMNVGIAYGSRGFSYGPKVLSILIGFFRSHGAKPFIIPAMGSHGGGTELGQIQVLNKIGINEENLQIPIKSSVDSVLVGYTPNDIPVYCDKYALEADGVFLFNRIKPHTAFRAPIESGLCKMMAIGLGKVNGAQAIHRAGLGKHIVEAARVIKTKIKLLGGLASIDNSEGDAYMLRAVEPTNIEAAEEEMLIKAWGQLPMIPFDCLNILIIDWMGKNISGSGMDVNIVGMHRRLGGIPKQTFETVVVLDLTSESKGNALGIGYADITTKKLVEKIDYASMYKNGLTAGFLGHMKIPYTVLTNNEAITTAMELHKGKDLRIVRIKDTKSLKYIWVSENLLKECKDYKVIKKVDDILDTEDYN